MAKLTLDYIKENTIWVAKMNGYRVTGTDAEIGHLFHDENCRDYDVCCQQPTSELQRFWEELWQYEDQHGFQFVDDYYNNVYNPKPLKERRVWTEEEIRNLVQTNDKVLYGALRNLYNCQTADEKEDGETTHQNGAGFNGLDAPILSSIAEFLNKNGFLTEKQKVLVRKKLVKYNRQLTRLANA